MSAFKLEQCEFFSCNILKHSKQNAGLSEKALPVRQREAQENNSLKLYLLSLCVAVTEDLREASLGVRLLP